MGANIFGNLGFCWNHLLVPSHPPIRSVEWACFRLYKMIPEFAWDLSRFENNPLTFPEIKNLLDGGEIFSKYPDRELEITAIGRGIRYLFALVRSHRFRLDENTILGINRLVANAPAYNGDRIDGYVASKNDARKRVSHDENCGTSRSVIAAQACLSETFKYGIQVIEEATPSAFQKAAALFLLGESCELVEGVSRPTIQLALNGVLLSAGIDPINIPFLRAREYNEHVAQFRMTKDGSQLVAFLVSCHPDAEAMYKANPHLLSQRRSDFVELHAKAAL
jgi:hypothetical protein